MGELYAVITAVVWGFAVIFLKRAGETVSPFALNLFRVVVSSAMLCATLLVVGQPVFPAAPLGDYLLLFASGIIAIAISDTLFHLSLNMVGAGISAIVDCLYSPFVVIAAMIFLGERLGALQFCGMALILIGIFLAAGHKPPHGVSARQIVAGVVWGVFAMVFLAIGIIIAKPVLNRSPVLWATTMRQLACLVVMVPAALTLAHRREIFSVFRPGPSWRFALPGTVLGSYLSLIFWIAGMKYTLAGTAAIINQASTIFVLIFASIFLKESFTRRKAAASALAVAGIVLVTLG